MLASFSTLVGGVESTFSATGEQSPVKPQSCFVFSCRIDRGSWKPSAIHEAEKLRNMCFSQAFHLCAGWRSILAEGLETN